MGLDGVSYLVLIGTGLVSAAVPVNTNLDHEANQYIEMAYTISEDLDFIYTLDQRNNKRVPENIGWCFYSDEFSYVNTYNNLIILNYQQQLNVCYNLFVANPEQFGSYFTRDLSASRFVWNSRLISVDIGDLSDRQYIRLLESLLK